MDGHDARPFVRHAPADPEVTVARHNLLYLFLFALGSLAGCSTPTGGPGPAPEPAPPDEPPLAQRTVVVFGPDDVLVAEILRIGDDARAEVRTPAGVYGEEILSGDHHYVRMTHAAAFLGTDRWIHADLTDPRQRRYLETNPAGFIALADLAEVRVGGRVAGHEVLTVDRVDDATVRIDLGGGRTIDVSTVTLDGAAPIVAPAGTEIVALADLSTAAAMASHRRGPL